MTSHWQRWLPALAVGTLVLAACNNGTRMAESQFATSAPVTTPASPTTTPPTTASPPTEPTVSPKPPTTPTTNHPPPTKKPPPTKPPVATGSPGSPLDLDTGHLVGKTFRVAVTGVNLDANQVIESENSFNGPPHGRYVLAELAVQYLGPDHGDPWIDLSSKFVGSDAREYDSNQCGAVVPHPGIFVPTLEHGGRAHYQICFDVPPGAIPRGKIFIEETFVFEGPRVYWKTR